MYSWFCPPASPTPPEDRPLAQASFLPCEIVDVVCDLLVVQRRRPIVTTHIHRERGDGFAVAKEQDNKTSHTQSPFQPVPGGKTPQAAGSSRASFRRNFTWRSGAVPPQRSGSRGPAFGRYATRPRAADLGGHQTSRRSRCVARSSGQIAATPRGATWIVWGNPLGADEDRRPPTIERKSSPDGVGPRSSRGGARRRRGARRG